MNDFMPSYEEFEKVMIEIACYCSNHLCSECQLNNTICEVRPSLWNIKRTVQIIEESYSDE